MPRRQRQRFDTKLPTLEVDYDWEALMAEARSMMDARRERRVNVAPAVVRVPRVEVPIPAGLDLRRPDEIARELGLDRSTVTRWAQLGYVTRYFVTAARGTTSPYFLDMDACRAHVAERAIKGRAKRGTAIRKPKNGVQL